MKKINVTVICPGEEAHPGCAELVRTYPEINLVAAHRALDEAGVRISLGSSDVLLLDEAVIDLEGPDKVRAIHLDYPGIRTLQIVEKHCENKAMEAISLGVRGMMERSSLVAMLRKAIMVLYSGETWMSRQMVQLLHNQSKFLVDKPLWLVNPDISPGWSKLN